MNKQSLKSGFMGLLKISFSVIILGFLIWKARKEDLFQTFWEREKNWSLLAVAGGAYLAAMLFQIFRWRLLARSLELELSVSEAIRLGFLSQLVSLFGVVGMLGGDALKTYMLGKQNRGRMTEAFATVMVDRMLGLYGLIMLAGSVSCCFDFSVLEHAKPFERDVVLSLIWMARAGAVGATIMLCVALLPGFTTWPLWDLLGKIPKLGGTLRKLVAAMRMYRRRLSALLIAILLSFGVHLSSAFMYCCISEALPSFHAEVAVAKPLPLTTFTAALLALGAGAVPVGGLELVFDAIYRAVSDPLMPEQQGLLIVFAFRFIQICTALIGLYYYLRGRREVDAMLHEAQAVKAN